MPTTYSSHKDIPEFKKIQTNKIDKENISRYSRQLILPELGVKGQLCLQNASILVVGAGGLGCPAALYLAAAGIGRLGLVDYDEVELSNLHRQVLHNESRVGKPKSASAAMSCKMLNSRVKCIPYHLSLNRHNALELITKYPLFEFEYDLNYDIVLDATDNVATRYLLNDACVLAHRPLVSGSALRFEGQLTVYNHEGGPCYRCLFPKPPPPETVTNCSDGGVLGVVPGIIGCMQALEAIKIATGIGIPVKQKLLMFDAMDCSVRTIRLRPRQKNCVVCGDEPTLTELVDYEQFCGTKASDKDSELLLLKMEDRISVQELNQIIQREEPHIIVDVRPPHELDICSLPNTINLPLNTMMMEETSTNLQQLIERMRNEMETFSVYVLCRRGNDSQKATLQLQQMLKSLPVTVKDVQGGLTAWSRHIDPSLPTY